MAIKGSPNKNRKKLKKPFTIADIAAIRAMDHIQLKEHLDKTLKMDIPKKEEPLIVPKQSIFGFEFFSAVAAVFLVVVLL